MSRSKFTRELASVISFFGGDQENMKDVADKWCNTFGVGIVAPASAPKIHAFVAGIRKCPT